VLSTIHSAKGQEWRAVFVLNVVDGCIPSDMATDTAEEIEEERRLLYVAMTRSRDDLVLMQPLRFYVRGQGYGGDRSVYAPRSRFIAESDLEAFELAGAPQPPPRAEATMPPASANVDLKVGMREMWR
jgi:DNA helicase-2/ATP-dependent DNA helicase PcrA